MVSNIVFGNIVILFGKYHFYFGISFLEDSPIKFKFTLSGKLPLSKELTGVQRKNLFLIIKEALHNSLKHSGAGEALVNFQMHNDQLLIEIADDGTGILNPNSFGNGIKNMKKRVEEINATIHFSSDKGTRIQISFPLT